jgi:geranylgeranyl reductase family protein
MSAERHRDDVGIVVVGAGPAGSTCAIHLAQLGYQITIVDQSAFPRDKPCGDGLTRSSIGALERLGLGQLVRDHHEIAGGRLVPAHGRGMSRRFEREMGQSAAGVCVPRSVLDHALLTEALRHGARLVQGRVEAPVVIEGRVRGVRYTSAGVPRELPARHVVAADGATSRLRRAVFGDVVARRGHAYAARAYFETERRLDPLFDIYVPLELHGRRLPGYAWVFPIGEHRANIGVGFFSDADGGGRVSIRRLFEATVEHLRVAHRRRFGDLEQAGPLFGSPLAIRFARDQCDCEGMTFVGDAANTVDPISGEGIAYAMRGAEIVADAVHERLRGTPGRDVGARIQRRFPRLGQDPWRWSLAAAGAVQGRGVAAALDEPFLSTGLRVASKTEADPSLRHTVVWRLAERHGAAHVEALERLDEVLLSRTATSSPLIGEIVHREIRAHGGPIGAATVLFSLLAAGGRVSDAAVDFASAVALTGVLSAIVVQLSDRDGDAATASANDRLVVMATDFAHSRAAAAAAAAGPELLSVFARGTRVACEGQMLQREGRGRLDPRHAERLAATAGAAFGLAAGSGAILARRPARIQRQLERFGHHFGCAWQVADELAALVSGERVVGRDPGALARRGFYCVSVLDVARRAERPHDAEDLVNAARSDEQALCAAADTVERHGTNALEILSTIDLPDPAPLASLVEDAIARSRDLVAPSRSLSGGGETP